MRRSLLLLAPVAILGGLLAGSSHIGLASTAVTGTFTDKPYTATTPDSGSDGNNWAIDLFTRSFVVYPKATNGTTTVVEHFNGGHFISLGDGATGSAPSPGSSDPDNPPGHLLREGVSGTFFGTFTIVVNSGFTYGGGGQGCSQVVSGSSTDDGCTTALWISDNFGGAVYNTNTSTTAYSLTYNAPKQGLIGHTWTDSSSGDSGDIYSSVS